MTIKAKLVKNLGSEKWTGDARLYRLSEPIERHGLTTEYVIVSATMNWGASTMMYLSDEEGRPLTHRSINGDLEGVYDHETAIEEQGWELED